MCMGQGNYAQIDALKLTFSSAIKCSRNADEPGLRGRAEVSHDEGSNKYFQQIDLIEKKKGRLAFQSRDRKHWNYKWPAYYRHQNNAGDGV